MKFELPRKWELFELVSRAFYSSYSEFQAKRKYFNADFMKGTDCELRPVQSRPCICRIGFTFPDSTSRTEMAG